MAGKPWGYTSTVPGRGWIDVRAATARIRTEYAWALAEVTVSVEDPIWENYAGDNMMALQKAIMGRLHNVTVIRGSVLPKLQLLRRIARADASPQGWKDFWGELLGAPGIPAEIITIHRWTVRKVSRPGKQS